MEIGYTERRPPHPRKSATPNAATAPTAPTAPRETGHTQCSHRTNGTHRTHGNRPHPMQPPHPMAPTAPHGNRPHPTTSTAPHGNRPHPTTSTAPHGNRPHPHGNRPHPPRHPPQPTRTGRAPLAPIARQAEPLPPTQPACSQGGDRACGDDPLATLRNRCAHADRPRRHGISPSARQRGPPERRNCRFRAGRAAPTAFAAPERNRRGPRGVSAVERAWPGGSGAAGCVVSGYAAGRYER